MGVEPKKFGAGRKSVYEIDPSYKIWYDLIKTRHEELIVYIIEECIHLIQILIKSFKWQGKERREDIKELNSIPLMKYE